MLVSVEQAQNLIFDNLPEAEVSHIDIESLSEQVLREDLYADRDYPPFHRVAMDGIALNFDSWESGQRRFPVQAIQRAGEPALALKSKEHCIEVMTGAALPEGCDMVIRYEDTTIEDGVASVAGLSSANRMHNIHLRGEDYRMGDLLLRSGAVMNATHWAVAASIGKVKTAISKRPSVCVASTGHELVGVGDIPLSHQIRRSNSYALIASLRENGFNDIGRIHLADRKDEIFSGLKKVLKQNRVLILSGGVSMGKFDFIPEVLSDLGVKKVFHKVAQKPGKPIWFGKGQDGQLVFGLPGNPVSALVCLHRYVLPALWKMAGADPREEAHAELEEEVSFKKDLTYFLPVKLRYGKDGKTYARPVLTSGSGDFAAIARSDGFIELPSSQQVFSIGKAFPVYPWRR